MSHQPFESYLFSDQPLDNHQQQDLLTHLRTCAHCKALADALNGVDYALHHAQSPVPEPGFTQRWHARLEAHRLAQQNRKLWLITLALFFIASLILITISAYYVMNLNWSYELTQAVARVSIFAAQLRRSINFFNALINNLPLFMPLAAVFIMGVSFVLIFLNYVWLKTIIKLYSPIYVKGNQS